MAQPPILCCNITEPARTLLHIQRTAMDYTITELKLREQTSVQELTAVWESSVRASHDFLTENDISQLRPCVPLLFCAYMPDKTPSWAGFIGIDAQTVEMLFVHPALFGKGIGTALLQHALSLGVRRVDVNEQNPRVLQFYQHRGFIITGRSATDSMGFPFPLLHLELPA